jgi:acetolactate synthase-1/2/3 large subunit
MSWDLRIAPTKCLIHINIDPTEIGKNYNAHIPLVGDAGAVINEISFRVLRHLTKREKHWKKRETELAKMKKKTGMYINPEKRFSDHVPLKPQRLINEMQESLPDDAILFIDVGNSLCWAIHYMTFKRPDSFITPFGLLTMGYGIAAAVGGKLAAGDRPVVCLAGDGCFMMNGMEVATAVNYNIPVVWIVHNNAKLGLVHDLQSFTLGEKHVATTFKQVNIAEIARGIGAISYNVKKPGQLKKILPEAIALKKPVVIECMIDPTEVPPLAPFIEGLKDFYKRLDMM